MYDSSATTPLYFLVPPCCKNSLKDTTLDQLDRDWRHFTSDGEHAWVCQSYVILRNFGFNVRLGRPPKGGLLFAHYTRLHAMSWLGDAYVVCLRADYPRSPLANFHIVQNPRQEASDAAYVCHWPMPGLIPRSRGRIGVRTVGIMGIPWGHAGRINLWKDAIESRGLALRVLMTNDQYNDFSDVDLLLAVRTFDDRPHDTKPPWKLLAAWAAGVPLVAGCDTAYQHIAEPGKHYLMATSFDSALAAIDNLCNNAKLYDAIVLAGSMKLAEFTRTKVAKRWEYVVETQLLPRYRNWRSSAIERAAWFAKRNILLLPLIRLKHAFRNVARGQHSSRYGRAKFVTRP